jgi:hypothetical protein
MGIPSSSSKQDMKISDYEKVKIPKEYSLIKLGSCNVNLHNTMNVDSKIKEIILYITSNHKNKSLDIICLQGFHDVFSMKNLIREFKKYCFENEIKMFFAPSFDDIIVEPPVAGIVTTTRMLELSFHTPKKSTNRNSMGKMKKIIQNIIISRYPIIDMIYGELDDKTDMDDILGIQTIIGANVLVGNKIMSIYNMCLSKDIKTANIVNISNAQVRMTELDTLMTFVDKNKISLQSDKFTEYDKSDIHLITGTFGINEFGNSDNNQEYLDLIQDRHYIDVFRYLNEKDCGYTTSNSERINYTFMNLTDDIYDKKSQTHNDFKNAKSISEMFDLLFKRYQIHFLGTYVIQSNNVSMYYPIESIFMIKS